MTDAHGNRFWDINVHVNFRIDIRVVYDKGQPRWELLFRFSYPGSSPFQNFLPTKVIELWPLAKDPKGERANELCAKVYTMIQGRATLQQIVSFCEGVR